MKSVSCCYLPAIALGLALATMGSFAADPTPTGPLDSSGASAANLQLGISYMQQGNLSLAREKIDKALKQDPKNPDARTAAAMLEERLGNLRKAEEQHRAAIRLGPGRPELSNNYAVFLCRTGKYKEGVKMLVAVAANKLYPTPYAAFTNAGVCARADKQVDVAAGYFRRALQERPNHAAAAPPSSGCSLLRRPRPSPHVMRAARPTRPWPGVTAPIRTSSSITSRATSGH